MPALNFGQDLTTQLVEVAGSPSRSQTLEKDSVTRKYKTDFAAVESLWPELNTALPDYPDHYLNSRSYSRTGEGGHTDVILTFETVDEGSILNPNAPLPPDEVEYIAATTERHIGAHPSYDVLWLGTPKTEKKDSSGAVTGLIDDPRGNTLTTTPTKPGVETYLIPTGVYRKTTYRHSLPAISVSNIATRNIPTGETGTNKWLKTGYTLKITKGVYTLSEEWMFLPIGTWDTDIYGAS